MLFSKTSVNHKQVPSTEPNSGVCRSQMKAREGTGGYLRGVSPTKAYFSLARSTSLSTLTVITPFSWFMPAAGEVCWMKPFCFARLPLSFFYFESHFREGRKACAPLRALLWHFCFLPIACLGLLLDSKMLRITVNRKTVCSFILFTQLPWILLCLNPLSLPLSVGRREKNGLFSICVYFSCSLKYFMAF